MLFTVPTVFTLSLLRPVIVPIVAAIVSADVGVATCSGSGINISSLFIFCKLCKLCELFDIGENGPGDTDVLVPVASIPTLTPIVPLPIFTFPSSVGDVASLVGSFLVTVTARGLVLSCIVVS